MQSKKQDESAINQSHFAAMNNQRQDYLIFLVPKVKEHDRFGKDLAA